MRNARVCHVKANYSNPENLRTTHFSNACISWIKLQNQMPKFDNLHDTYNKTKKRKVAKIQFQSCWIKAETTISSFYLWKENKNRRKLFLFVSHGTVRDSFSLKCFWIPFPWKVCQSAKMKEFTMSNFQKILIIPLKQQSYNESLTQASSTFFLPMLASSVLNSAAELQRVQVSTR